MSASHVHDVLGRAVSFHNRASGPVAVLLALCCCLSAAHSQWLEETIYLPDSCSGLICPECLAYDSANNTVYVAGDGGGCVIAIDGTTNQGIARIPT
jgi:hypothetical protein